MKMKIKLLLIGFTSSLFFVQSSMAEEADSPLLTQMEDLSSAYKALRREEDPAKGVALARQAQDAAIKAITETPALLKDMPDGPEKAKASAEYRMIMGNLISSLAKLELAFLENDLDKVKEILINLRDLKSEGHDKFIEDDE